MIELYKELVSRGIEMVVEPYNGSQALRFEFRKDGYCTGNYFTVKELYEKPWLVADMLLQDVQFFDMAIAGEETGTVKKEIEIFKDISEKVAIKKKGPSTFKVDKAWHEKLRDIVKFM